MQNEIIAPVAIPDVNGRIPNPGWARTEVMHYTRENIKAPWFRRKEWDYYLFTAKDWAVAFTISDLGYAGLLSASFLDFKTASEHTESEIGILPGGKKYGLGVSTADAHAECHTKRLDLIFENRGDHRHISCSFRHFDGEKNLTAELDVFEPDMEAVYIATPWAEKDTAFYYNCKRNCLEAEGTVTYGDRTETATRDTVFGVLDWGRGVWTYDNTWFWGTGSGRINGEPFGLNLGYGFTDRSSAGENGVYYGGKIHKLTDIAFNIPLDANGNRLYTDKWTVTGGDGRFEAEFVPILDRCAKMDFKVIVTDQHQVFGRMRGKVILDDGTELRFSDLICALEVVRNKY